MNESGLQDTLGCVQGNEDDAGTCKRFLADNFLFVTPALFALERHGQIALDQKLLLMIKTRKLFCAIVVVVCPICPITTGDERVGVFTTDMAESLLA